MTTWYREGLVTLTAGSDLVAGVGTEWVDNVLPGGIFFTPAGLVEVERVISDTSLKLVTPYGGGTVAGAEYSIAPTQGYVVALAKQLNGVLGEFGELKDAWQDGTLVGKGVALKGVKDSIADLPAAGSAPGDAWMVDGHLHVWTGSLWRDQGAMVTTPEMVALRDAAETSAGLAVGSALAVDAAKKDIQDRVYPGTYLTVPTTKPSGAPIATGDRAIVFFSGVPYEHVYLSGAWMIPNLNATQIAGPDGALLSGFRLAPTGTVTTTVGDQLKKFEVRLSDFGAVQGGVYPANSPLKRAATFVHITGAKLIIDVDCTIGDSTTLEGGVLELGGTGKITQTGSRLFILNNMRRLVVGGGLAFATTITGAAIPPLAFLGHSVRDVACDASFDRLMVAFDGGGTNGRNQNCLIGGKFTGDFTGATGGDTANIVDVRGYEVFDATRIDMYCLGAERFIKSANRNSFVRMNDFNLRGSCTKQVIDGFDDTRKTSMDNGRVDVTGATCFYENKQANFATAAQESVAITNTFARITNNAASSVIAVQGAWGQPTEPAGYTCSVDLTRSTFELISTNTANPVVSVRGVTSMGLSGVRTSHSAGGLALRLGNIREISCSALTMKGYVTLEGGLSSSDNVAYTKQTEKITFDGFTVLDYAGSVVFRLLAMPDLKSVTIKGGTVDRATAPAASEAMIYVNNCPSIALLNVNDVEPTPIITGAKFQLAGTSTVTKGEVRRNGWQKGRVDFNPGTLAAGAALESPTVVSVGAAVGDVCQFIAPYDLNGVTKSDYVGGSNAPRTRVKNTTAAAITLGAGSWSWETWKIYG